MTNDNAEGDAALAYWMAVRGAACAICRDAGKNAFCGLRGRLCALAAQLPLVVKAIASVRSDRVDDAVRAIEEQVCPRCHEQDARGRCRLRDRGDCALYTYLPLVMEAIEEVKSVPVARGRRRAARATHGRGSPVSSTSASRTPRRASRRSSIRRPRS